MAKNTETFTPIAHVRQNEQGEWVTHPLDLHLRDVAVLSGQFAQAFGSEKWAVLAGLWHDLGKYRPRFQRYIRRASGYDPDAHIKGEADKAPHSTAGALWAKDNLGVPGHVLSYLIAGHHAGLYDWDPDLAYRLARQDSRDELSESLAAAPASDILAVGDNLQPDLRTIPGGKQGFALWVRMLFSCLVDADFLDTERFMDENKWACRAVYPAIGELLQCFDTHMEAMATTLAEQGRLSPVNSLRADILGQCRAKALEAPGLFSLTVPTGGGKTLASMAFALRHAQQYGKHRVIFVIPYTSIIEQTADVFRKVFQALEIDPVIEHHSNAEADPNEETSKSRLACENWDAPIIVTTNVQFFESLFAARTSRCRKLHNLVNSVVVLDEAQLLPPEFLQPILDVLNLLARHYGVTAVLSTATQPALSTREYFDSQKNMHGLENVRELMAGGPFILMPDDLYDALKRVEVHLPDDMHEPISWESLAIDLQAADSVLCIVNRRKDARELFKLMPEGTLHLSALMCGAHRSDVIQAIKLRLKAGKPTQVISTQLVEAGVDLDFPVVYRALAGLDSIAQAAGRCNREGVLETGNVVVFIPPQASPAGLLRKGENACRAVLHGCDGDPLTRTLFAQYFEKLYYACDLDAERIGELLTVDPDTLAIGFRSAAEKFRLIQDEDTLSVVVRYRGPDGTDDTVDGLLRLLRKDGPARWLLRKLQRYTVTVRRKDVMRWERLGDVEAIQPGLYAQVCDIGYSNELGLTLDEEEGLPGQVLMA